MEHIGGSELERNDNFFMRKALQAAAKALEMDEVPVGAVIVANNEIIARGWNQRELLQDPTAHAEILALSQAAEHIGSWRLINATLYVTLEPCPMCAGALVNSRIKRLVYGASDPKAGYCGSLENTVQDERLNHNLELTAGILSDECSKMLQDFFKSKRQKLN